MSGEWGSLLLQVIVTIAVVLGAIAGLYWLVRRYSGGALGRLGRGRVPRLAIVDATSVDARRQLVLIRRDNVEHLILIGGPSDVVVEQSIQRRRRPQPQAEGAASPEAEAPAPANPPIPFPQIRPQAAATAASAAPRRASPPPPPPPLERESPDIAAEMASILRFSGPEREPAPMEARPAPAAAQPSVAMPMPFTARPPIEEPAAREPAPVAATSATAASYVESASARQDAAAETASQVNDLEREMARLLGEITAKRS